MLLHLEDQEQKNLRLALQVLERDWDKVMLPIAVQPKNEVKKKNKTKLLIIQEVSRMHFQQRLPQRQV
jgi:hypothetical protein